MSEREENLSETSLRDLADSILATRNRVILALITLTTLYWSVVAVMSLALPPVHTYATRILYTFSEIDQGAYPNGTPFRIGDLVAPSVLNKVYDKHGIGQFIDQQEFIDSFSIVPHTPARDIVIEKYAVNLPKTAAELEERQQRLTEELTEISFRAAELRFTTIGLPKMPDTLLQKAIWSVPIEWNDHRVRELAVLEFDKPMYTASTVNRAILSTLDYLIAFEMILDRVRRVKDNVNELSTLPNSFLIIDEESGYSLADLSLALDDMVNYRIAPLMNPVRSLGISKDREAVSLYFENVYLDLERESALLSDKLKNVRLSYSDYLSQDIKDDVARSSASPGAPTGTMIPQFGAEFIDRIVDMTNAGADIEYRQELNRLQLKISNELADNEANSSRIRQLIDSLRAPRLTPAGAKLQLRYSEMVETELPSILNELEKLFDTSGRLMEQISINSLGVEGKLYRLADGDITHHVEGAILSKSNLWTFGVLLFLCLVAVVPLAMFQDLVKRQPIED